RLNQYYDERLQSYIAADELRQSSDELTRFARSFAATGDPDFEKFYLDVIAIRNGDKPRPVNYERIYWDLVIDYDDPRPRSNGPPEALRTRMEQLGFTPEEFALLDEANSRSDALIGLETEAMNAVKGRYPDASGNFTIQGTPDREAAVATLFSTEYHAEKAQIMEPINQSFGELISRTNQQ